VSLTTIHIKGTDNAKINVNGNEKEGFTLTLIISANGSMLKPVLTAKGKTEKCLKKYDLNEEIVGTYSNNGWTNVGILKIIIDLIYSETKNKKTYLLMDQYSTHVEKYIKEYCDKKNIEIILVPKGLTYKYQPLDVMINGILKKKAKTLWRKEIIKNSDLRITNSDAVKHFLIAKKDITSDIIKKSFQTSLNFELI